MSTTTETETPQIKPSAPSVADLYKTLDKKIEAKDSYTYYIGVCAVTIVEETAIIQYEPAGLGLEELEALLPEDESFEATLLEGLLEGWQQGENGYKLANIPFNKKVAGSVHAIQGVQVEGEEHPKAWAIRHLNLGDAPKKLNTRNLANAIHAGEAACFQLMEKLERAQQRETAIREALQAAAGEDETFALVALPEMENVVPADKLENLGTTGPSQF